MHESSEATPAVEGHRGPFGAKLSGLGGKLDRLVEISKSQEARREAVNGVVETVKNGALRVGELRRETPRRIMAAFESAKENVADLYGKGSEKAVKGLKKSTAFVVLTFEYPVRAPLETALGVSGRIDNFVNGSRERALSILSRRGEKFYREHYPEAFETHAHASEAHNRLLGAYERLVEQQKKEHFDDPGKLRSAHSSQMEVSRFAYVRHRQVTEADRIINKSLEEKEKARAFSEAANVIRAGLEGRNNKRDRVVHGVRNFFNKWDNVLAN